MPRSLIILAALMLAVPVLANAQRLPETADAQGQEVTNVAPARFRPADLWARLSRARWHSFSLYSLDLSAGYSNYPLSTNSQFILPQLASGNNALFSGTASMGFAQRWARSDLAISYSPHFYQQSNSHFNSVTHNAQLHYRHAIGRRWELGLNAGADTSNRYSTMLETPVIASAAQLQAPIANQDLLTLISEPAQLTLPAGNLVLAGFDVMRADAGIELAGYITDRTRLFFSGSFGRITDLGGSGNAQLALLGRESINRVFSAGVERQFTRRYRIGLRYVDQAVRNTGLGTMGQRQAQATLGWLPARKWSLFVAAGPALRRDAVGRQRADIATQFAVSRSAFTSLFTFSFQRELYLGGLLPGGVESHNTMFQWTPRPRGRHWIYSFNAGYMWMRGQLNSGYSTSGWLVEPTLAIPISRSLQFYTQYSFFSRRVSDLSSAFDMSRHMAVVGLRWRFVNAAE